MKDIPVFATEYGVASLFLQEIPYRKRAHVKIQSASEPEKLVEECIAFCRACGAQWIDASGDPFLEKYPLLATLVRMQIAKDAIAQSDACLFPVTEKTVRKWLDLYNLTMETVPNSAYMDDRDGKELLKTGDGYFVHKDGELIGIGKASDGMIHALASLKPGMGETVVRALAEVLQEDTVCLMVAEQNAKAMRLYQRMGFVTLGVVSQWYQIF